MADLLEHLVLPNSSEESFHSAVEQDSSTQLPLTDSLTSAAKLARDVRANALEAAGLPVYDIDAYLSDPKNAALLASTPAHKNTPAKALQSGSDPAQPVALGSKSSHHVTALNILCQQKGLMPKYEIDGDISNADFGGLLRIGEMTIACDDRWHSKKEVREALAAKGVETFKAMETAKRKEPGTAGENRNWVGLLLEYHHLANPNLGPVYLDYGLGLLYACTCTIPSLPNRPFGSSTVAFPSKKAARSHAAREAVEHLISEGHLNPDGTTKTRKKVKLSTAVKIQGRVLEVKKGATYAQKVQDICPLLGLQSPQYILAPASALAPNMLNGHATFVTEPGMPKEIGEVRNIYGKRNAKEEIAKGVWDVLKGLAAKRNVEIGEVESDEDAERIETA